MQGGGDGCGEAVQVLVEGGRVLRRLVGSGGQGSLTAEPGPAEGALPVRKQRAASSYWEETRGAYPAHPSTPESPHPLPRQPPGVLVRGLGFRKQTPTEGLLREKCYVGRISDAKRVDRLRGTRGRRPGWQWSCAEEGRLVRGAFARPVAWKMDLLDWSSDFILSPKVFVLFLFFS